MPYRQLSENERYVISHLQYGYSAREIARRLGRHHTTICREFKRARAVHPGTTYYYTWTHPIAVERRRQPRHFRRQNDPSLVAYVEAKLRLEWPPEAIAHRIRLEFPDDERMRISHETIYRWVYLDSRVGGRLYQRMRRQHPRRRKQRRYGSGRRFQADRVGIEHRPEEVSLRQRFGDWEGDTVAGKQNRSHLVTHVERKSRYLLAGKLADRKADTFAAQTVALLRSVPTQLRHTLTLDNGSECSQFPKIEQHANLKVYFADPYAAWQRGTNENTNGLLRQYFPKGTDLRRISDEKIQAVVERLNHRPRKCLGYQTPHEVFAQAIRGALAM